MVSNLFVSRGGIKLQAALNQFQVSVEGKIILDVGSSTGGFVDCLLQNGAIKVYALDTCYGELAWKLRNDPRVVVMERTNILFPDTWKVEKVDLITIDAGWTRLELILPIVKKFLKPDGMIIALLKPHYETQGLLLRNEADRRDLIKGVLPPDKAEQVRDQVVNRVQSLGFRVEKNMESPILGGAGNMEYLLSIKL